MYLGSLQNFTSLLDVNTREILKGLEVLLPAGGYHEWNGKIKSFTPVAGSAGLGVWGSVTSQKKVLSGRLSFTKPDVKKQKQMSLIQE